MSFPKMRHNTWLHFGVAILLAVAALLLIRLHYADGATPAAADSVTAGHKLAEAWCAACHAIDASAARSQANVPDFVAVANLPSTTELALKVFLQSSHSTMPNLVLTPEQRGDLVNYILSLKRT
jgi:mono/diheme cytochrome c family protein